MLLLAERGNQRRHIHLPHPVERPERVQAGARVGAGEGHLLQRRDGGGGGLLHQQALRGVAPPAVRMRKRVDEVGSGRGRELRLRAGRLARVDDAVDATVADDFVEAAALGLLAQVAREEDAVLENAVIHIHEVKAAVGAGVGVDGPEEFVGRGEELGFLVGICPGEFAGVFREHHAANEVGRRLRDKRVALKLSREIVTTINDRAAGGGVFGERAVRLERGRLIATVDAGVHARGPDRLVLHRLLREAGARAEERVAEVILAWHEISAELVGVGVVEGAAPVIHREAPLAARGRGRALPLVVHAAKAEVVVRGDNPVVHHPRRAVAGVLGILKTIRGKVLVHQHALAGFEAGLDGIPEERGRLADEHAAVGEAERARHDELVEEDSFLVHHAVAVRVLEDADAVDGFQLARGRRRVHVAGHLDDPDAPGGVPLHRDGRLDERFGGDDLDAEAGRELEGLERGGGGERRVGGDFFLGHARLLFLARLVAVLGESEGCDEEQRK